MSSAARAERSAFRRICTLHAAALDAAAFCMEVTAMTKITIFSGFLGAGKTTLIKKLIPTAYKGEKLVLIENEFGEIGIDGGFMKDAYSYAENRYKKDSLVSNYKKTIPTLDTFL